MTDKNTFYLVDASPYIFRAYYSIEEMLNKDGEEINAVYGFSRFVSSLISKTRANHIAFAFDESLTTSFRNKIYPEYKQNRELPPVELAKQMTWCQQLISCLGITSYVSPEYEADDLIGAMIDKMRRHDFRFVIVSPDKDFAQLLQDNDVLWDFARDRQFTTDNIKDHLGVPAHQVVDYLALAGDAVDNIPGIPGIGAKTAARLLEHFDDLQDVLENADAIGDLSIRGAKRIAELVANHRHKAELSYKLARIFTDIEVGNTPESYQWKGVDTDGLSEFFRNSGLSKNIMNNFIRHSP